MKIVHVLFIFSMLPLCCQGQANALPDDLPSAWHWGISASADYIKFPASGVLNMGTAWGVDLTEAYSDGETGWSVGPYLSYRLSRHWEGQAGLIYMNKKMYVTSHGPGPNDAPVSREGVAGLHYLSLPISLKYYLFQQRNAYFIATGLSVDKSLNNAYIAARVAFSHRISLGGLIKIYEHLSVQLEPVFQYAVSDYRKINHTQGIYRFRPHSFGIMLGIRKDM